MDTYNNNSININCARLREQLCVRGRPGIMFVKKPMTHNIATLDAVSNFIEHLIGNVMGFRVGSTRKLSRFFVKNVRQLTKRVFQRF